MQYWSMQLHPSDSPLAMKYAVESIAAGYVGLDLKGDVGDLSSPSTVVPAGRTDYFDFARRMQTGDKVLVIVHHFPFALVTVESEYIFASRPLPELGVWFRHFRRIERQKTRYYGDHVTNAREWERLTMTDTISILSNQHGKRLQLMRSWE